MSLSGFDSESVGFDSVTENVTTAVSSSTQTTEYGETSSSSQTAELSDFGCTTDLTTETLEGITPEGLNEFLRKVVPSVMQQLQLDQQPLYNTSDSDDEEALNAKLLQEIETKDLSTGDYKQAVLSVSWSAGGGSLAVSLGSQQHETWCEHEGIVKIYTAKRSEGDKYAHAMDITEKNCINVVKFHQKIPALMAYGTNSGEVVICNLQGSGPFDSGSAMSASHESRITCLKWTDINTTNNYLMMHVLGSKNRRLASDQVLVSASSDGCVNVWQINTNAKVFQNIITYKVNANQNGVEITCLDFMKAGPLRPSDEKDSRELFVVGTVSGNLYICDAKKQNVVVGSAMVDPVSDALEGHGCCVLDVEFSCQKQGVFASISMDSEIRVYDVKQHAPIKVICLEDPVSCMGWVLSQPNLLVVGLATPDNLGQLIKVYNMATGRCMLVEGMGRGKNAAITCLAVHHGGACFVAAGDEFGALRLWELPLRRLRYSFEDCEF